MFECRPTSARRRSRRGAPRSSRPSRRPARRSGRSRGAPSASSTPPRRAARPSRARWSGPTIRSRAATARRRGSSARSGSMTSRNSATEPGQPCVMINGNASGLSERAWMKWICWPSMSVRKCGQRLNRVFLRAPVELRAATCRRDPAGTRGRCRSPNRCRGSGRASACAPSRSRRSSSTASGTSTRNGRISSSLPCERATLVATAAVARFPGRDARPASPRSGSTTRSRSSPAPAPGSAPASPACSTRRARGRARGPARRTARGAWRRSCATRTSCRATSREDGAPEALVAATLAHYGRVDVLVNNAGTSDPTPAFDETTDHFTATLRVNLVAPFELARECARAMIAVGDGRRDRQRRVDLGTRRRRPDPRGGVRGVEGRARQPHARAARRSGRARACA